MKSLTTVSLTITVLGCFLLLGCSSESDSPGSDNSKKVVLGKIELSNGWARPGNQGETSGAYLTISNGTASRDTLINISSEIAQKTDLHESFEDETGIIEMRPAGQQTIDSGNNLQLEPGGLHIMLINLNRDLAVGDSLSLSLEFARVGSKTIKIPVQMSTE